MKTYLNKFFKRNSIQRILIVYFLIFILMIVGLLYAVSAQFMSTTMINNYFSEYLDSIYSDFEKTLNKKFVQINVTATDITIWNELYKIIVDEEQQYDEKLDKIYDCMRPFLNSHDWIYGIDFVKNDGNIYRLSRNGTPRYDTLPSGFADTIDKMKLSIYDGVVRDEDNTYIAVGKKFYNYIAGRDTGYFIMYINADFISSIYDDVIMGDMTFMVTVNNTVISCVDDSLLGKKSYISDENMTDSVIKEYRLTNEILSTPVSITEMVSINSLSSTADKINKSIAVLMHVLFIITAMVVVMLMRSLLKQLVKFKESIGEFSDNPTNKVDFKTSNELYALQESFSKMVATINNLIEENAEISEKKRIAEIETLQAQINPHFIYNAIDIITCMAILNGQKDIENVTYALATFFRIGLSGGENLITIKDELYHVKSYLKIEQVRFPDLFELNIDVDESLYDVPIVKVVLQPLVENAIKHSLKKVNYKGRLEIWGREIEDDRILFCVSDNGIGMDDKTIDEINESGYAGGFGLKNVHERLELEYGEGCGPFVERNAERGITVKIIIIKRKPMVSEENPNILDATAPNNSPIYGIFWH